MILQNCRTQQLQGPRLQRGGVGAVAAVPETTLRVRTAHACSREGIGVRAHHLRIVQLEGDIGPNRVA